MGVMMQPPQNVGCLGCLLGHHSWEMGNFSYPMAPYPVDHRSCTCCGLHDSTSNWTGKWKWDCLTFEERQQVYRDFLETKELVDVKV